MLVYKNLLEFYQASFDILSKKGVKLVLQMALKSDRLPKIIEEFLKHAETLHKLIQSATAEIVRDIQTMLYDQESKCQHYASYSVSILKTTQLRDF